MAQCREIGIAKRKDMNANDDDAAMRMVAGSARAMGLKGWSKTMTETTESAARKARSEGCRQSGGRHQDGEDQRHGEVRRNH
jgi:LSU ribosomal protein L11P